MSMHLHMDIHPSSLQAKQGEEGHCVPNSQHFFCNKIWRQEAVGVVPNSLQDIGRASDGAKRRPAEAEGWAGA
jgi:hypothetical protein